MSPHLYTGLPGMWYVYKGGVVSPHLYTGLPGMWYVYKGGGCESPPIHWATRYVVCV